MGHSSQQINVSAHVAVWYAIAAMVLGAKPLSEKVSRMAFLLYILFLQLASAHHLLVEPGLSSEWKIFNTSYAMYLAVLGSMIHGMTVPGSIEAAQRAKGFNAGPLRVAAQGALGQSGLRGHVPVARDVRLPRRHLRRRHGHRADQPDHAQHAVRARPFPRDRGGGHDARLHGSDLSPRAADLPARGACSREWRAGSPTYFGLGVSGISLFMMGAGTLGVARRHWDITFADAPFNFKFPDTAFLMLASQRHVRDLAALGGVMYVIIAVASVFFGKRIEEAPRRAPTRATTPPLGRRGRDLRQRGNAARSGNDRAGRHLLRRIRPLLLRQLEVSRRGVAVEVIRERPDTRAAH